ncbi:hypothetical protein [Salinigranum sp. GCM10025319]|uniref:hypothetical protein n=1 Tax=Salinigranum sp. GCM10025319 TaxID=3252687 RepID=UPI0036186AE3
MTVWELHWPEYGVENGEFVDHAEEIEEAGPLAQKVILVAGLLMPLFSIVILGGFTLLISVTLVTSGIGFAGSSIVSMLFVVALALSCIDMIVEEIALSPVRGIASVLAVVLVLLPVSVYAWIRYQTPKVKNADRLPSLANDKQMILRLFKSVIPGIHPGKRRLTDGGKRSGK